MAVSSNLSSKEEQLAITSALEDGNRCLQNVSDHQKSLNDMEMAVDTVFYAVKDLRKLFEKERKMTDSAVEKLRREIHRLKSHTGPMSSKRSLKSVEKVHNSVSSLNQHKMSFQSAIAQKADHVIERLKDFEKFITRNTKSSGKDKVNPKTHSLDFELESPYSESEEDTNSVTSQTSNEVSPGMPVKQQNETQATGDWSDQTENAIETQGTGGSVRVDERSPRFRSKFLTMAMERSRSVSPFKTDTLSVEQGSTKQRPPTVLGIPIKDSEISYSPTEREWLRQRNKAESQDTRGHADFADPRATPQKNHHLLRNNEMNDNIKQTTDSNLKPDVSASLEHKRLGLKKASLRSQSLHSLSEDPEEEERSLQTSSMVGISTSENSNDAQPSKSVFRSRTASWKAEMEEKYKPSHRHSFPSLDFGILSHILNTEEENGVWTKDSVEAKSADTVITMTTAEQEKDKPCVQEDQHPNVKTNQVEQEAQAMTRQEFERPLWTRRKGTNILKRCNTIGNPVGNSEEEETAEEDNLRRIGYLSPALTSVPIKERSFIGNRIRNLLRSGGNVSQSMGSLRQLPRTPTPVPTFLKDAMERERQRTETRKEDCFDVGTPADTLATESVIYSSPTSDKGVQQLQVKQTNDQYSQLPTETTTVMQNIPKLHLEQDGAGSLNISTQNPEGEHDNGTKPSEKAASKLPDMAQKSLYSEASLASEIESYMPKDSNKMEINSRTNSNKIMVRSSSVTVQQHLTPRSSVSTGDVRNASPRPSTPRKLSRLSNRCRSVSPRKFLEQDRLDSFDPVYDRINSGTYLEGISHPKSPETLRKEASRKQRRCLVESRTSESAAMNTKIDGVPLYRYAKTVLMPDHKTVCCYQSIVILENGITVAVDKFHRRLGVIDSEYKPIHDFRVVDSPGGICSIGKSRVALAMPDHHSLRLFRITANQIRLQKEVKIDCTKGPVDVCFRKNMFYALCRDGHVHILDPQGRQEGIVSCGISCPEELGINDACDKFYILQEGRVTCYDLEGDIVWRKTGGIYTGMLVQGDKVIVSDRSRSKILSLLPNGVCEHELATDNIESPLEVALSINGDVMLLTQYSDSMQKNKTRIIKVYIPYVK